MVEKNGTDANHHLASTKKSANADDRAVWVALETLILFRGTVGHRQNAAGKVIEVDILLAYG